MKTMKRFLSMLLVMMMLLGCAAAQEDLGSVPSLGVSFPMTQADVDAGIEVAGYMQPLDDAEGKASIPAVAMMYTSALGQQAMENMDIAYETGDFDAYEAYMMDYFNYSYALLRLYLTSSEEEQDAVRLLDEDAAKLAENDGYTVMAVLYQNEAGPDDDVALLRAVEARAAELLEGITYQPVELTEADLTETPETEIPNAFPKFATKDLDGNDVDNSIFAQKDLTIINIWGTSCYPCISEMPELAEWNTELPENVQLIGLVGDVFVEQPDYLETAQMICEATGVNYVNLMVCADLLEFMQGIIFTPTTIFVDRSGAVVGEPVCGAYVDQYKAFVEEYINAQ